MSSISVYNLHPAGQELFQDSESFLNDLTDGQDSIVGGELAVGSAYRPIHLSLPPFFIGPPHHNTLLTFTIKPRPTHPVRPAH